MENIKFYSDTNTGKIYTLQQLKAEFQRTQSDKADFEDFLSFSKLVGDIHEITVRTVKHYQDMIARSDYHEIIEKNPMVWEDVFDFATANYEWIAEAEDDFCESAEDYKRTGSDEVTAYIRALVDFTKYPELALAGLEAYLQA